MEAFKNSEEVIKKCFIGSASVGERGQIVIPAEARQRLGLKTGDKLLVFVNPLNNGIFLILPSALDELHRLTTMLRELMEK
ncbi:MAG: AbrB/MazE/SpoVT family DNA-binding domain-containing protein [bacterium]